ncbi:GNAT family N-acetyltransferase [Actinophytocola glycyrrhizae]|uniref:GNAT family N-acetyltransferase n=1 Tax=Actinophytocola glycyrrhizae TaxID=2044873 RepID=A0ABV9RXN2_9PSEU
MTQVSVMDAFTTPRTAKVAERLVFEYLAATQVETGWPEPTSIDGLPPLLRNECRDLRRVHRQPGGLWLAHQDGSPVGCVGLVTRALGTAEVKRLYVRPTHRGGIGRVLMNHVHQHAEDHYFTRVVVSVVPTRTAVIDFYRRLGYTDTEPYDMFPASMVNLRRPVTHP